MGRAYPSAGPPHRTVCAAPAGGTARAGSSATRGRPGARTATGYEARSASRAPQGASLTTVGGVQLGDTDHSLKAGERGPTLLQDHHLREKITHFDHERIPEQVPETTKQRGAPASYDDHFSQATLFWRSMSAIEQEHIVRAYTFELGK